MIKEIKLCHPLCIYKTHSVYKKSEYDWTTKISKEQQKQVIKDN